MDLNLTVLASNQWPVPRTPSSQKIKKSVQNPTCSCSTPAQAGGATSGHKTTKKIHSISSLDLLFPNIFLICHDLKDFFFIAIQISFVSPLVLPEAGLLLLITHFVYQMPFYETCCALAEFFFFALRTGQPFQCQSCLLPPGFAGEDLVAKAGISQLWSDGLPISTYKRSEPTAPAKCPLQGFSAGTTAAV